MSGRATRVGATATFALMIAGCATLGGNVKGDFSCRAPEGSCAPTSMIDDAATRASQAERPSHAPARAHGSGDRGLRIVLAGYRDEGGRIHEARVVHVVLPDRAAERWRVPRSTGDVLRALAHPAEADVGPAAAAEARPFRHSNPSPKQPPDVLVIPSQDLTELPGANAPDPGASGRPPSPGQVPHPVLSEGEPK
ncbi:hypothetical protein MACH24_16930 [Erythrobacter sp. Dej080120_24]|uniref:hypothetical protein n=1 Tax=Erythrobacter sp. Dej080120_24 TaxID=3024837 RepID=UPI00291FD59D|nr:hypothetical protein MACH24_16930 [Erythrobacter sp. Dej080120_24]